MGTSDLFRNLEWQIETYLAPKTIEFLRQNWSYDISPEENLTRAVTSAVPYILESHNRWAERMGEQDRDLPESSISEKLSVDETDAELIKMMKKQLQESK